jgi:zinc transport system permease protein
MLAPWIDQVIQWFCHLWPQGSLPNLPFFVYPAVAILFVALVCGAVGSLVVGNRMSFFSDALAHCAFAGVALGIMLALLAGFQLADIRESRGFLTAVMVTFGIIVGVLIAFVREKTSLSSDTVIGVFFAGAVGLGAMLLKAVTSRGYYNLEMFLFGYPTDATADDIEWLFWLALLTGVFLYNDSVFASFNTSLARSRGVRVRLCQYLFIMLLGIIVNLSIQIVGVLLINALLIVPAATAANLSRNMRQFFWFSVLTALGVAFFGYWLSLELKIPDPPREPLKFGVSGTIVVLSVLCFTASMLLGPWLRRRTLALPDSNAESTIAPG